MSEQTQAEQDAAHQAEDDARTIEHFLRLKYYIRTYPGYYPRLDAYFDAANELRDMKDIVIGAQHRTINRLMAERDALREAVTKAAGHLTDHTLDGDDVRASFARLALEQWLPAIGPADRKSAEK